MQHGQAVAVVQRQGGDPAVIRRELEVAPDRVGVARHVAIGEPDELGRSGGTRSAEQQRQLRVQRAGLGDTEIDTEIDGDARCLGPHGRRRAPRRSHLLDVAAGEQRDVPGGHQCQVADDVLDGVGAGEEHDLTSVQAAGATSTSGRASLPAPRRRRPTGRRSAGVRSRAAPGARDPQCAAARGRTAAPGRTAPGDVKGTYQVVARLPGV